MKSTVLRPNVFTYNNVMQAWAVSGLPEAPDKMEALLQMIHQEGIVPDGATYTILLRYWGGKGEVDRIETILATMKSEGVKPRVPCLTQAIYGYAKAGKTERAEELLQEMAELQPKNKREAGMIGESMQNILLAYRNIVDDSTVHRLRKDKAVNCAEVLFGKMSGNAHLKDEDQSE
jgi:pentatricopeptide repeat protein